MEQLLYDARLAARNLRRRASTSAMIVLTLATGVACTTAMFSVVRGVLLRSLPWPDSDRLAVIWNRPPRAADPLELSQKEIGDLQELLGGVEVGGYSSEMKAIEVGDRSEMLPATWVTREVFEMLGARPILGRTFAPDEYRFGGPATVILSHEAWRGLFAGEPQALGTTVEIDGIEREIVGVMPPDFPLPLEYESGERTQLWLGTTLGYATSWSRETRMFPALGRLAEGTTVAQAQAELDRALVELRRRHPAVYGAGWRMSLVPIEEQLLAAIRPALLALFGAVFFVLLIACANVAHLLLAQNDTRRNEIAVRNALGAQRGRLLRQLMLENLALAMAGGVLGTLGAYLAVDLLLALEPGNLPRLDTVSVDGTVLLFGLAAALTTALLFGLLPALKIAGGRPQSDLHRGRAAASGLRGDRGRRMLVIAEIALATVLLTGAGLLIETLRNLARADLGFEPRGLAAVAVSAPREHSNRPEDLLRFWDLLRARAGEQPGVDASSLTMSVPLYSGVMSRGLEVEGAGAEALEIPRVTIERSGPGIVSAMGFRLLRGRDLSDEDRAQTMPVAMVNETLARYLEGDALGSRVRRADGTQSWLTVVGVVADAVHESIEASPTPRLIVPYTQFPATGMRMQPSMFLVVRSTAGADAAIGLARSAVREADPESTVLRALAMDEYLAASALARYRFAAFVLGFFGVVAIVLAIVGIYGLLSYLVGRGRREVGVRMAVGARQGDIYRLVLGQGVVLALGGLLLGIPAALWLTRLVESLLYGVTPTQPEAFVRTALLLLLAAVGASLVPARRATEVEPIEVLHSE